MEVCYVIFPKSVSLEANVEESLIVFLSLCTGRQVGMDIGDPLTPFRNMRAPFRDVRDIIQFFNEKKTAGLKLIIVIVPDKTGPVYGKQSQNFHVFL